MTLPGDDAPLDEVANALAAPGKGLLASDESVSTIGKRLEKVGLPNDEVRVGLIERRKRDVADAAESPCKHAHSCTLTNPLPRTRAAADTPRVP